MSKKIPISFNKKEQAAVKQLADRLGLANTYGMVPRCVKLGIILTNNYLDYLEEIIPDLEPDKLDLLLSSIKRLKVKKYKERKLAEVKKEVDEYNPSMVEMGP